MTTLEKITSNLSAKGVSFELNYPQSTLRYLDVDGETSIIKADTHYEITLGIEGSRFQWSWYTVYEPDTKLEFITYENTYSQKTGRTRRAWRTGMQLLEKFQ